MQPSFLMFLLILVTIPFQYLQAAEQVAGFSHKEAMRLGEKMYRTGILPSGKPMKAFVMGDIPVDGSMFTCDDCHQRSGLGSEEGTVITWPTNGKELYAPRRRTGAFKPPVNEEDKQNARRTLPVYYQVADERPAYTDKSLAKALRMGVDPTGRRIDPIMPKYRLNDSNMALLVYYLKHLSVELSPGVDDATLFFATVVSSEVTEDRKNAMLSVLRAHIDAHNSQSRHEERRSAAGPFYKSERHKSYRKLDLQVWELNGPEETWTGQLENYYSRQPVFALLGGITDGSWDTIHTFSEEHKLPCIFPVVDLPAISETDWYTLYFSKGYHQEGESSAKYLRASLGGNEKFRAVQVYRQGNREAAAIVQGFAQSWQKMGVGTVENVMLEQGQPVDEEMWQDLFNASTDPVILLLWLAKGEATLFKSLVPYGQQAAMLFASSTLLQRNFDAVPDELRSKLRITYPATLPQKDGKGRFLVERWLKTRGIPQKHFDIQAKMYFLGWMLPGALKSMRSEFFREYFLERFDMMIDQDYAIAVYPRLTFGSGQRYASKGCYIVKLTNGPDPELEAVSDWIIH